MLVLILDGLAFVASAGDSKAVLGHKGDNGTYEVGWKVMDNLMRYRSRSCRQTTRPTFPWSANGSSLAEVPNSVLLEALTRSSGSVRREVDELTGETGTVCLRCPFSPRRAVACMAGQRWRPRPRHVALAGRLRESQRFHVRPDLLQQAHEIGVSSLADIHRQSLQYGDEYLVVASDGVVTGVEFRKSCPQGCGT